MEQLRDSSSSTFSVASTEQGQKEGEKSSSARGVKQKSFPDRGGDETQHATTVNCPSALSPVVPAGTPSRGQDPDSEAKARARRRDRAISAAADHTQDPIHSASEDPAIPGKDSSLGYGTDKGIKFRGKAAARGAARREDLKSRNSSAGSSDRSTGKIRLAPGSEPESVSPHKPPKVSAAASDEEGPGLSNDNGLGGNNQAESVEAAIGALTEGEGALVEMEIAPDFESAVDEVRRAMQETQRNQVSQHQLHGSESQGEVITTAFLVENDDTPREEDKLCGAPRKVCYGLIAFVVIVAVAIAASAGAVLLSKDDTTSLDSSTRYTSTPTAAPSSIPTITPRLDIDLLANVLLPGVNISNLNETSPQYRALEWLAYDDPRNIRIEDDLTELLERFSLVTFYYATWGLYMLNPLQWLSGSTHCNWTLITCENDSVVEISFTQNYMPGTLPTEIGNFRNVRGFFLGDNWITGTIPTEVGLLTSATSLHLNNNNVGGTLPTEIGNLILLESISVAVNGLVGLVPSEIGLLSSLTSVQLGGNFFDGGLPIEVTGLGKISSLGISGNWLEGSIHTEFGKLTNLSTLQLQDNRFEGQIPSELGLLSDTLSDMGLSRNKLSGLVPTELGALTRLSALWLDWNQLQSTLPSEFGNLSLLIHLSVASNTDMVGSIPTELGRLSLLTSVDFSNSSLTGIIPSELGNMSLLTSLDISSNRLLGTIPSEIGNLRQLTLLNLSGNNGLIGTVPVEVGQLESIMMAYFHSTSITGGLDDLAFCGNRFLGYFIVKSDCGGVIPERLVDRVKFGLLKILLQYVLRKLRYHLAHVGWLDGALVFDEKWVLVGMRAKPERFGPDESYLVYGQYL
eukprot:scaffold1400_cov137-Cylindrotheca_fusiformis.AAC.19